MSVIKTKETITVYIAGPMRGHEEENFPAFYEAERVLKKQGVYHIINPARLDDEGDYTAKDYIKAMARDIAEIFTTDSVYMLRGWERSAGARVEHALAVYLGLYIIYQ